MAKQAKDPSARKPIFKRWWFWIIIVLIVFAAASGGETEGEPAASSPDSANVSSDAGASQADPAIQTEPTEDPNSAPSAGQLESQAAASIQEPPETTEPDSVEPALEAESEPEPDAKEALEDVLGGTTFYEKVRNDGTGKWRELVFYSSEDIVDHAVEYYNAYYSSDDEIHIAVNLGLKTTSIMNVSNGVMYISVHEYVDKEEHDAKVIGSGMLLKSYSINLETGKIEDLSATD